MDVMQVDARTPNMDLLCLRLAGGSVEEEDVKIP